MSTKVTKRTLKRVVLPTMESNEDASATLEVVPSTASPKEGFDVSFAQGKRLVLSTFNGKVLIHVREYMLEGEREFPTKKGVCFTPGRLSILRRKIGEIDEALRQQEINASYNVTYDGVTLSYKAHLGGGIYASVNGKYFGVSLRRYWIPEGQQEIIPTKNGIYLPKSQWSALKRKIEDLLIAHPELVDAQGCISSHDGQLEAMECRECMPFGWMM